jgi:hypothetical protein
MAITLMEEEEEYLAELEVDYKEEEEEKEIPTEVIIMTAEELLRQPRERQYTMTVTSWAPPSAEIPVVKVTMVNDKFVVLGRICGGKLGKINLN